MASGIDDEDAHGRSVCDQALRSFSQMSQTTAELISVPTGTYGCRQRATRRTPNTSEEMYTHPVSKRQGNGPCDSPFAWGREDGYLHSLELSRRTAGTQVRERIRHPARHDRYWRAADAISCHARGG